MFNELVGMFHLGKVDPLTGHTYNGGVLHTKERDGATRLGTDPLYPSRSHSWISMLFSADARVHTKRGGKEVPSAPWVQHIHDGGPNAARHEVQLGCILGRCTARQLRGWRLQYGQMAAKTWNYAGRKATRKAMCKVRGRQRTMAARKRLGHSSSRGPRASHQRPVSPSISGNFCDSQLGSRDMTRQLYIPRTSRPPVVLYSMLEQQRHTHSSSTLIPPSPASRESPTPRRVPFRTPCEAAILSGRRPSGPLAGNFLPVLAPRNPL